MSSQPATLSIDDRGIATLCLRRPEVHNAFDDGLIARLTELLAEAGEADGLRALLITAEGRSFSAGADAGWMKRAAGYDEARNIADALALGRMLEALRYTPFPTIALVQGAALGGGVGLVACADIAIAAKRAVFGLTEVRLGLTPASIAPYVIAAMGPRQARRYMLSGERFDAAEAYRLGLVHEVVADEAALNEAGAAVIEAILASAPGAVADCKRLIDDVAGSRRDAAELNDLARRIAARRADGEGCEGLAAFLEKRKPSWVVD